MSKEPKVYRPVHWPCLKVTEKFTYINGLPYTAKMLERRQARLLVALSERNAK